MQAKDQIQGMGGVQNNMRRACSIYIQLQRYGVTHVIIVACYYPMHAAPCFYPFFFNSDILQHFSENIFTLVSLVLLCSKMCIYLLPNPKPKDVGGRVTHVIVVAHCVAAYIVPLFLYFLALSSLHPSTF